MTPTRLTFFLSCCPEGCGWVAPAGTEPQPHPPRCQQQGVYTATPESCLIHPRPTVERGCCVKPASITQQQESSYVVMLSDKTQNRLNIPLYIITSNVWMRRFYTYTLILIYMHAYLHQQTSKAIILSICKHHNFMIHIRWNRFIRLKWTSNSVPILLKQIARGFTWLT